MDLAGLIAKTGTDGRWHAGIGDPTTLGWVTTLAYLLAAATCFWAWRRETAVLRREVQTAYAPAFWLGVGVVLALLGVNKQLDLQSWFTQVGRDVAWRQGWYDQRKGVQAVFVAAIGVGGVAVLGLILWWLRGRFRRYRLGIAGLVYLGCFVIIRAASFHHIDRLLKVGLNHVRINHVLELGGITLVACGAIRAAVTARAGFRDPGSRARAVSVDDGLGR